MSLMWVSVTECSQSHIYHLTQMIKEDEDLRIILSSGTPYMDERGDGGLLKKDLERMLSMLGVPSHLKGYQYLKAAIDLSVQSMEELGRSYETAVSGYCPYVSDICTVERCVGMPSGRPGREEMKGRRKSCLDTATRKGKDRPTRNLSQDLRIILRT